MLPSAHRLRTAADFTAVLRGRSSGRAASELMVVSVRTSADPQEQLLPPRVGFVVSKAVGNSVVRHRTQRRLRHLMATQLDGLPPGSRTVVRANPAAADADSEQLGAQLRRLVPAAVAKAQARGSR